MRRTRAIALAAAVTCATGWAAAARAQPAPGEAPPPRGPFDRGRMSLGLTAGSTTTYGSPNDRHIFAGGGLGYFVLPGLELSLAGLVVFSADPAEGLLSPAVRYVVYQMPGGLKPYVGGFYNHWFVGNAIADVDSLGGRAGLITRTGNLLIGFGVAYETVVSDCSGDCSLIYPELTLGLAF